MFRILVLASFVTGICAESSSGSLKAYDYSGNYGSYSRGKSDESESLVSSQLATSGGFSPSNGRYSAAASHDSVERGASYLSSPYSSTPAYGTKFKSASSQQAPNYESLSSYKSSYASPSTSAYASSGTYSYIPISGHNQVDYSSGFTGSAQGTGNYENYPSQAGSKSYASQGTSRGSSVDEYSTSLRGSSPSYVSEGTSHSSGTGSSYAGYEGSANSLRAHSNTGNNYVAGASVHALPTNALSHEYSVTEPEAYSGANNEAPRYSSPMVYSSEIAYKDPAAGYAAQSPHVYSGVKSSYPASSYGNHVGGYPSSPTYIRISESPLHSSSSHHPNYVNPNYAYSQKAQNPPHMSANYPAGPTKIIYVRDNSFASNSYPGGYSGANYKNKVYSLHGVYQNSPPAYANAPSSNLVSGYNLPKGYGSSSHGNSFLSYL